MNNYLQVTLNIFLFILDKSCISGSLSCHFLETKKSTIPFLTACGLVWSVDSIPDRTAQSKNTIYYHFCNDKMLLGIVMAISCMPYRKERLLKWFQFPYSFSNLVYLHEHMLDRVDTILYIYKTYVNWDETPFSVSIKCIFVGIHVCSCFLMQMQSYNKTLSTKSFLSLQPSADVNTYYIYC